MSVLKQILLSLVVIAVAVGGWYVYSRWDSLGGGSAVGTAGGAPAGGPGAAPPVAAVPPASGPSGAAGVAAGPGGASMTPEQRQAAFAARQAGGQGQAPGAQTPGGQAPAPGAAAPAAEAVAAAPGAGVPGAGGGAGAGGPPGGAGGPPAGGRPGGRGPGATLVVTGLVETDTTGSQLRAVGTLAAARAVTLFPPASGVLAEVAITTGATVATGDMIARLDDAEQLIAVERAELALDEARKAGERAETLSRSNNITEVALATARAAVTRAEIDLRSAQIALDRRRLGAPFAGTVGIVTAQAGDTVSTTTALTTLDDLSTLTAAFLAPQGYATRLALGHPVTATAEGAPGVEIRGTVTAIDSRVDETTRTFQVVATLTDGIAGLKPGMSVVLSMDFPGEPRPSVPSQAVQWDRNGSYVWKLDGDQVRRTPVSIVSRGSGMAVLAGALSEGEEIVVEGLQRLREGARVTRSQSFAATLGAAATAPAAGPDPAAGRPAGGAVGPGG